MHARMTHNIQFEIKNSPIPDVSPNLILVKVSRMCGLGLHVLRLVVHCVCVRVCLCVILA